MDNILLVVNLARNHIVKPSEFSTLAYIHKKRIERAQYLIITTDFPLSEVAAETGFKSQTYFPRTFKEITGQTPTQYKKINSVV